MITATQEKKLIERIKGLSEIEFASVIREIADHVETNKLDQIIKKEFNLDYSEEVNDIQNECDELQDEANDLRYKLEHYEEIETIVDSVMDVEEWEEGGFDKLKEAIVKIKAEL